MVREEHSAGSFCSPSRVGVRSSDKGIELFETDRIVNISAQEDTTRSLSTVEKRGGFALSFDIRISAIDHMVQK